MAKRTVSLLNSLGFTVEEAQIIVRAGEIHSYPRDTTIAQNLYANETLFFVLEGSVNVVTAESEGQQIVLANYDAGEYFGGFEFGKSGRFIGNVFKTHRKNQSIHFIFS